MRHQENNFTEATGIFDIRVISQFMEVHKVGLTSIQGRVFEPIARHIEQLKNYFESQGFLAYFDKNNNSDSPHSINLSHNISQTTNQIKTESRSVVISILLFVTTVFTTLMIGALNQGGNPFVNVKDLLLGVPFSFSLLLILTGHELGHYFTARKHKVAVTLPYFLPIPHPLIGTMGAFIRIKSVLPNRNALIRIGLAGPLAGFILAIPITVIGIKLSHPVDITQTNNALSLGSSLLFQLIYKLTHPHLPVNYDLMLHPMAFAGWFGFFVTAINLMPIGQLDGGHIAYAIFGNKRKYLMISIIVVMALLGLKWPGWYFWILLVLFFGLKHPKAQDEITTLTKKDKILGLVAFIILILAFIPNPFIIK